MSTYSTFPPEGLVDWFGNIVQLLGKTTQCIFFICFATAFGMNPRDWSGYIIDYRCDGSRFRVSAISWLTSPNPASLSSSETRVHLGIRRRKRRSSESAQCQEAIGVIYFTERWRPEDLHCGLEIGKSQPRSKVGNFECMSWLNGSFFGGWTSGFSGRGSQDLPNVTNVAFQLANIFFIVTSIVYGIYTASGMMTIYNQDSLTWIQVNKLQLLRWWHALIYPICCGLKRSVKHEVVKARYPFLQRRLRDTEFCMEQKEDKFCSNWKEIK